MKMNASMFGALVIIVVMLIGSFYLITAAQLAPASLQPLALPVRIGPWPLLIMLIVLLALVTWRTFRRAPVAARLALRYRLEPCFNSAWATVIDTTDGHAVSACLPFQNAWDQMTVLNTAKRRASRPSSSGAC